MDIKKSASRVHFRKHKRNKGDTDQLAAQLAPLEEQDKPAAEQQIGSQFESSNGQQTTELWCDRRGQREFKSPEGHYRRPRRKAS